jgi:hypothetical protein
VLTLRYFLRVWSGYSRGPGGSSFTGRFPSGRDDTPETCPFVKKMDQGRTFAVRGQWQPPLPR